MADTSELTVPELKPPLQNTSAPRDKEPEGDLEKLRKWQEDRVTRKLRGEYESAVLHLSEVVNSNIDTHLRLASVRVEGAAHTRKSFLASLVHPYVHAEPLVLNNSTLGSVLQTSREIGHLLNETDIFASVVAKLEPSRDVFARPGDIDLVFQTKEKSRMYLKTTGEIGNNEGGASVTGRVRNVFGGAEVLEASISLGSKTLMAFNASLSAPLTGNLKTRGELSVFGLERDNTSYCSAMEGVRGLKAVVRNGSFKTGLHQAGYEAVLRQIGKLQPAASISMREAAGQSIKSSVFHSWTRDTRDDSVLGTHGSYLKIFQEFAGLGGDASFYKAETSGQFSRPIIPGLTVSLGAKTGLLWALDKPTLFSDRFHLGGPSSVRMFRTNSMGPRDGVDSLGGDFYWSAGLSLISNIPRKPHWPVKLHGFVNAGRLDSLDKSKSLQESVAAAISKPSISAGVGIVYRLDPLRVEMNFGVPLTSSKGEGSRKGFQLGVGVDFL